MANAEERCHETSSSNVPLYLHILLIQFDRYHVSPNKMRRKDFSEVRVRTKIAIAICDSKNSNS